MNKHLIGFLISALASGAAIELHSVWALLFGVTTIFFFIQLLRESQAADKAGRSAIKETDEQLRVELAAVQKLAITKLAGADEATVNKVVDLLLDAGKHLGNPYINSRVVYGSDYFIDWNREGLASVAQAKQLIESYTAGK